MRSRSCRLQGLLTRLPLVCIHVLSDSSKLQFDSAFTLQMIGADRLWIVHSCPGIREALRISRDSFSMLDLIFQFPNCHSISDLQPKFRFLSHVFDSDRIFFVTLHVSLSLYASDRSFKYLLLFYIFYIFFRILKDEIVLKLIINAIFF